MAEWTAFANSVRYFLRQIKDLQEKQQRLILEKKELKK